MRLRANKRTDWVFASEIADKKREQVMAHRLMVVAGENEALRALPEQLGDIEVRLVESANDALWEVRAAPPEAIIADIDLPDMGGLDMAEILPSFDVATRIIVWSRETNAAAEQQAAGMTIQRFLQGPVETDELHSVIREALDAGAEAAAAAEAEAEATAAAEAEAAAAAEAEAAAAAEATPEPEPAPQTRAPARAAEEPMAAEPARPAERTTTTRGLRAATGRLAARTRDTIAHQESSTTEHTHHQQRRRDKNLVLTADNLAPIRGIMSQLSQELGPQCVMLTDHAGMVLVEVGNTDTLPTMILLPLLSTSFATSGEVARQLGEEDAMTLYIHEGVNYDVYSFDISQRFLLVLVFNKKVASAKIGAVWVNTKRAIRELQDALS
jgi:DNA-binding NarL/FixJ family response regulator